MDDNGEIRVDEIMEQIRERIRSRRQPQQRLVPAPLAASGSQSKEALSLLVYDLEELRDAVAAVDAVWNKIGAVNPRPPGLANSLVQFMKKLVRRGMAWYTRPLREFGESVARSLNETERACEDAQVNLIRLDQAVKSDREAFAAEVGLLKNRLQEIGLALQECEARTSTTPSRIGEPKV